MAERVITTIQALNEALRQEMERDPTVVVMGEDVSGGAGRKDQGIEDAWGGPFGETRGLIRAFGPDRVIDTPISETGFIGAAVGAAATGLRPVAELMFIDFVGVCFDQLLNNAAKMRYMFGGKARIPLTVLTHYGGGINAAAQHSQSIYALFVHVPGLKVVAPSDAYSAKGLLIASIRDDDPVIFCNHKVLLRAKANVPEEAYTIPIGQADVKRAGGAVTLIGIGRMTQICLQAAEQLEPEGIAAEEVDVLSISPLDEDTILSSVRQTKRAVVVDEGYQRCGLATDLAALLGREVFDYLHAPVQTVTAPHTPVPFSPALEKAYLPNAGRVVEAARAVTG